MQKILCNGCFEHCGLHVHESCSLDLENIHGGIFPSFSMQQKSLYKDVICHFLFFASVLQLLVTFSHPALDLGSWVTVSCFFPSNNKSFPCLVINNKLGASVLKSGCLNILGVPIKWKKVSGLEQSWHSEWALLEERAVACGNTGTQESNEDVAFML